MAQPITIDLYSDVHCPYAYVTVFRLRKLRDQYAGTLQIAYKSLALEYVNKQPTPKPILDNETPILMLEEPDIPYQPWHHPVSEWPVTMWPAFEAIKCAERQGVAAAAELDWAIRQAFFAESRCISMRHVLFDLADESGLDMRRFAEDYDSGVTKRVVLQEAQAGWEQLRVPGSPTFVLPNGEQHHNPGLPKVTLDPKQHFRVSGVQQVEQDGLTALRQVLATVQAQAR